MTLVDGISAALTSGRADLVIDPPCSGEGSWDARGTRITTFEADRTDGAHGAHDLRTTFLSC